MFFSFSFSYHYNLYNLKCAHCKIIKTDIFIICLIVFINININIINLLLFLYFYKFDVILDYIKLHSCFSLRG